MVNIEIYPITTGMGRVMGKDSLPFLTKKELDELNSIGYSGADSAGKRMSKEAFLNSLGKGQFDVRQTKFDDGSFMENFTITRVTLKERPVLK